MDRLHLEGIQHMRQYDDERPSTLTVGSSASSSLYPLTPASTHGAQGYPPSAYPQRPPVGQYPSASHIELPHVPCLPDASSSRPVSAPSTSFALHRELEQYKPERSGGTSGLYGLADSARRSNVLSACLPCKKAHLGCDKQRPCKRCVNMGKDGLCEDVPHKKRGRPKQPKLPLSEPYSRVPRPVTTPSAPSSYPGPLSFRHRGSISSTISSMPFSPATTMIDFSPTTATSPTVMIASPTGSQVYQSPYHSPTQVISSPPHSPQNDLFELFTTVDFKIVRTTPAVYDLTGYHSYEFLNLPLGEFIHPFDVESIHADRVQLLPAEACAGTTKREAILALNNLPPRELLSPAMGMPEMYPNQNVRFRRANGEYACFNVRLHLGGGLGADLTRSDTFDKMYFVVSFLFLDQHAVSQQQYPPQTSQHFGLSHPQMSGLDSIRSIPLSPTYTTASAPPSMLPDSSPPHMTASSLLPSFRALAAGADIGSANAINSAQAHINEQSQMPQTQGAYSPHRTNAPPPVSTRTHSPSAFRWPTPIHVLDQGQGLDTSHTHSKAIYADRGPPPFPSPSTTASQAALSGLTLAPFGSASVHPMMQQQQQHHTVHSPPAALTMPYPQYPPRHPDDPPDALAVEERTRKISGWSDTSRRAWEL